jgi:hypothetical protein
MWAEYPETSVFLKKVDIAKGGARHKNNSGKFSFYWLTLILRNIRNFTLNIIF